MIKKKFTGLVLADIHCAGEGGDLPVKAKIARDINSFFDRISLDPVFRFHDQLMSAGESMEKFREILKTHAKKVDQVFIAGDITDMGRRGEYRSLLKILDGHDPAKISLVPGNHEYAQIYLMKNRRRFIDRFKKTMDAFLPRTPEATVSESYYPYAKVINEEFVVFGLDTSRAAPMRGPSKGMLGNPQLDRLDSLLGSERYAPMHRILLMHHDVTIDDPSHHDFVLDRDRFIEIINRRADGPLDRNMTIICGHTHTEKFGNGSLDNINFIAGPYFSNRFEKDYTLFEINEDGIAVRLRSG